jgi:hypothetical protein
MKKHSAQGVIGQQHAWSLEISIGVPQASAKNTGAFDICRHVNAKIFIGASHLRQTVFRQIELSFGDLIQVPPSRNNKNGKSSED